VARADAEDPHQRALTAGQTAVKRRSNPVVERRRGPAGRRGGRRCACRRGGSTHGSRSRPGGRRPRGTCGPGTVGWVYGTGGPAIIDWVGIFGHRQPPPWWTAGVVASRPLRRRRSLAGRGRPSSASVSRTAGGVPAKPALDPRFFFEIICGVRSATPSPRSGIQHNWPPSGLHQRECI
jgi:hypothetical protein